MIAPFLAIIVLTLCIRSGRPRIARPLLRLVTAFAGLLFLYSVLSPFAAGHHH